MDHHFRAVFLGYILFMSWLRLSCSGSGWVERDFGRKTGKLLVRMHRPQVRLRGGAVEAGLVQESEDEESSEACNPRIKGLTPLDMVEEYCPSSQRVECTLTPAELFQVPIKYVVQNSKFTPANGTEFSDYQKRQVSIPHMSCFLCKLDHTLRWMIVAGQMLAVESRVQIISQLHRAFKKAAKANDTQTAIEMLCTFRKVWEDNKPRNSQDEVREYLAQKIANEWEILLIQTKRNPSMQRTFMQWMGKTRPPCVHWFISEPEILHLLSTVSVTVIHVQQHACKE
jgi:hypothetical protein